jgi:hypothetical protein
MTRTSLITVPLALVGALTIGSGFASADQERHRRGEALPRAEAQPQRDSPPHGDSQPRGEAQRRNEAQPRREAEPQRERQPRAEPAPPPAPRVENNNVQRRDAPRAETFTPHAVPRTEPRRIEPRDDNRYRDDSRYRSDGRYRDNNRSRYDGWHRDSDRYRFDNWSYSYRYRPRYFGYNVYRPYVFRPQYRLGLGVFIGYPVPYSYSYAYPVPVYGYRAPIAPVFVGPGSTLYGGIALDIWPDDAAVYVDGVYAGIVRDFDGTRQPLTLLAGTHRLEITGRAGYAPLVFDVTVEPGQVIPYQGELRPY